MVAKTTKTTTTAAAKRNVKFQIIFKTNKKNVPNSISNSSSTAML